MRQIRTISDFICTRSVLYLRVHRTKSVLYRRVHRTISGLYRRVHRAISPRTSDYIAAYIRTISDFLAFLKPLSNCNTNALCPNWRGRVRQIRTISDFICTRSVLYLRVHRTKSVLYRRVHRTLSPRTSRVHRTLSPRTSRVHRAYIRIPGRTHPPPLTLRTCISRST